MPRTRMPPDRRSTPARPRPRPGMPQQRSAPMRPDPERARLAAEALARARADAWARGDRPGTLQRQQSPTQDSEREGLTPPAAASSSWSARPRRDAPQPLTAAVGGLLSARG